MLAKSFRALTKFLILASLASPALARDVFTPFSTTNGLRQDYQANTGFVDLAINLGKFLSGQLDREDQQTHTMTVIFAMENADTGETSVWYNPKNDTAGRVRVILTQPVQGGYCRHFVTEVRMGKSVREYNETGCRTIDSRFWNFSGR